MNWIENLYQTYENCVECVGDFTEEEPLLPLSHTTQNAHIEITLDGDGNFRRARVLPKSEQRTLIPCTEASGGRSGAKPTSHPLSDKLQYLAGDFVEFGGGVTSGFLSNPNEPHDLYLQLLTEWCQSPDANPKVQAVLSYVKKGTLIADLVGSSILYLKPGQKALLDEWSDEAKPAPAIFGALPPGSTPEDAVIRWVVEMPGELESRLWQDPAVWQSWSKFYEKGLSSRGYCYVLGREESLAIQHPAKLRHGADKAKLISSNDSSGFTFRGRFTDPEGSQVCGVSFDVTQKAHNALRWLIARQGRRDGDQAIVAWAVSGKTVPPLVEPTAQLLNADEDFIADEEVQPTTSLPHAEVGQDFAIRLKKKIGGYRANLGNTDKIVIMALGSATPGRMSITYYRELDAFEFLDRIEQWHRECAWFQNFGKDNKFVGAPAPKDIAACAYGRRLDDKLQAATQRRLLPCIIESVPIPGDVVESSLRRASARLSMDHWEWEKTLGVACSLYRKQQASLQQHTYTMSLERDRSTKSYLYGRLLAVADLLEGSALRSANERRDTNAARFMQRFADHPYTTWRNIELSLDPYRRRLQANAPGLLNLYDKELREIMDRFAVEEFEDDGRLEGEFLLAYHTQRTALWTKQPKDTIPDDSDQQTE